MRPSNPKWIALDVETTGKDWTVCKPHGLGVSYIRGQAKYYLWKDIPKQVIADIENPNINKIGHNLHNYDAKVIRKSGIDIKGLFHGTEVIWNLVDSGLPQLDLKYLADRFIGTDSLEGKRELDSYIKSVHAGHIGGLCALDITCDGNPHLPIIAKYCEEDVNNTVELFYKGRDRIKEMQDMVLKMGFKKGPLDYYREEAAPLEYVLFDIEYKGIRVALDKIEEVRKENINKAQELVDYLNKSLRNRLPKVEAELYAKAMSELAPKAKQKTRDAIEANKGKMFTWSNPNHFACLLYKYCGLLPPYIYKTKKGKYQTDKMAIQGLLAAPIPKRLKEILRVYQDYKKCLKIISTYTGDSKSGIMSKVRYVDDEGNITLRGPGIPRIFQGYRQTTETGRLAASNPNMQNLQKNSRIKTFFIPDNPELEVIDDADYSQIELRLAADLSGDISLCTAYQNGEDIHIKTGSVLAGRPVTKEDFERQVGKTINFLTIFRGGPSRLISEVKKTTGKELTMPQAKEFITKWFEEYHGVDVYLNKQLEFFESNGFCISKAGRIRWLPDIKFGKDIKWVPVIENGVFKRVPRYTGSDTQSLQDSLYAQHKSESWWHPTETDLGWEARRRYNHAAKAGYNQPIQGGAVSGTKRAMIDLHRMGKRIMNQVHDSLVICRRKDKPEERQILIDAMVRALPLSIPVAADTKTLNSFHPEDKA